METKPKVRPEDVPVDGYPKGPRIENTQSYIGHPYYDPAIIKKRHDALFARSPLIKQREIAVSSGPMEWEREYGKQRLVSKFVVAMKDPQCTPQEVKDYWLKQFQNRYYALGWVLDEENPKAVRIFKRKFPQWWMFVVWKKSTFKSDRLDPYLQAKPKQLKDMLHEANMKKGKIGEKQDFTSIG